MQWSGLRAFILTTAVLTFSGAVTSAGAQSGVREVSATDRGVIPLQTRLRYTTMVILPDGEEILDVLCGDRDFWVISATHNIAHVKPAKAGAETNLNLVTSSGTIYSFMLTEKSSPPDLKVYVQGDPSAAGKPKYYSATQVEVLESQIKVLESQVGELRESLRDGQRKTDEAVAAYRQQYPTRLQFPYGSPKYEKPFLVRSMWHDGQFTYVKSDATELPALYELKDGKPAIVNFQVREGTYIVPKVLDRGYLALGTQKFTFEQHGR
jgi:type IV secretory pathway VirB9-like protein